MTKKKTNIEDIKRETVEEFLARGGQIQRLEPVQYESKEITVRTTTVGSISPIARNSNPFSIEGMSKEDFEDKLKGIASLSQEEKDRLLGLAEGMNELSFQSPDLERAGLLYGEKITRKKKEKTLDKKEIAKWSNLLSDDIKKKLGL